MCRAASGATCTIYRTLSASLNPTSPKTAWNPASIATGWKDECAGNDERESGYRRLQRRKLWRPSPELQPRARALKCSSTLASRIFSRCNLFLRQRKRKLCWHARLISVLTWLRPTSARRLCRSFYIASTLTRSCGPRGRQLQSRMGGHTWGWICTT